MHISELTFERLPQAVSQLYEKLDTIERLIIEKSGSISTESDQLLTIQEAGEFLNLSVPTIYGYVHKAEIPVSKKGKRLYFSKKELTDWIKSGRRKTIGEVALEAELFIRQNKGGRL